MLALPKLTWSGGGGGTPVRLRTYLDTDTPERPRTHLERDMHRLHGKIQEERRVQVMRADDLSHALLVHEL